MTFYKEKESYEFKIMHHMDGQRGIAYGPDSELIVIDGVNPEEDTVRAKVTKVLVETIMATKVGKGSQSHIPHPVRNTEESPYPVDDEEPIDYSDKEEEPDGEENENTD